jgi:protein-glutamine gamma-glutamyltransferase
MSALFASLLRWLPGAPQRRSSSMQRPVQRLISRPMSRDKADTLLLLASCAMVLAPHVGHLPAWISAVCTALLLWRGWLTFRGNRMPPRWLLLPAAILAMAAVLATYKTFFGRDAGVAMLALLLTLKLLEMHARRDLFVVLFLSFFLILVSFFYSQSIGTALLTLVALIALLTTQLSFHYTGAVPPLKQRIKFSALILALAAPLTLVLFLLFPRIQGPLWGLPGDAQEGRTGLSDTMSPGNIARLAQSEDIAFRAKFADPLPAKPSLYWRGVVLGHYDGRTWTQLRARDDASHQIVLKLRGAPVHYEVTLEPHARRWLFALDVPQAIPRIDSNPAGLSADLELLAANPVTDRLRYQAASHVDYDLQPNERPAILYRWLQLPAGFNPQTLALAAEMSNRARSDAELVAGALRMFREQPFRYTLEPPLLGRNAVDDFLFTTRAGFCEHYASAFVVLMRAMSVPARVVTGYQGGEVNPADGFLAVRQSDAHAWAEVWLEKRGWVRVDPTAAVAPGRVEHNLGRVIPQRYLGGLISFDASGQSWLGQLRSWRQNWDAVTNAWNQWVLNYTPDKQRDFIASLGFKQVDWSTMTVLLMTVGGIVAGIVLLPLLMHRPRLTPVDALYQKLCRRLARQGLPRAVHEGPRAYAARLTATASPLSPARKEALARFLHVYETIKYGPAKDVPLSALSTLKSLLAECR